MDRDIIIEVAEKLYREANPGGTKDTPSFVYEMVEKANERRVQANSDLPLYQWCKKEMEDRQRGAIK